MRIFERQKKQCSENTFIVDSNAWKALSEKLRMKLGKAIDEVRLGMLVY